MTQNSALLLFAIVLHTRDMVPVAPQLGMNEIHPTTRSFLGARDVGCLTGGNGWNLPYIAMNFGKTIDPEMRVVVRGQVPVGASGCSLAEGNHTGTPGS
eukprot:COSAG05_NODE_4604_length_1442_cov_1.236039_3_plen_99_part_00